MGRMIFDLTDDDRDALERLRSARGLRSHAETLRVLIRENTADGELIIGVVETPRSGMTVELPPPVCPSAPRVVKGVVDPPEPTVHVTAPYAGDLVRRATPKKR